MVDNDPEDKPDEDEAGNNYQEPAELDRIISPSDVDFTPRIGHELDLHLDLDNGVILGRSAKFHEKFGSSGLGLIGAVSEVADDESSSLFGVPVLMDLMSPHVVFVAGKRGSGKSYTLGIFAEALALSMGRNEIQVAGVIVDTVDVFRQMVEENADQEDLLKKWGLEAKRFPVSVYIPRKTYLSLPDEVKKKARLLPLAISPRELTASEWGYVLERGGQLSTSMTNLIGDVLESIRKGYTLESGEQVKRKRDFSIADMISCIENNPAIDELYQTSSKTALIQRLRRADRLGVFHTGGTSAQDLAVGGQISIIDVAPLGSNAEAVLAILTNMLSRQVLTYRMAWTEEGTSAREELPPTWLIIDEAHTLVPRAGNTPAKDAIIGYAKLGRRFGCSLILCTQQPSAVADEAISQADIILSHSLSHQSDIRALHQRAPAFMPDQFKDKLFISSLPRGVALVFDQSTENKRAFIMQVRPRMSQHGGADRLSGIFQAAALAPDQVEDTIAAEEESAEPHELPSIPRPPLKLSKEDWAVLDDWMRDYVERLFEERLQEYTITEDEHPHIQTSNANEDESEVQLEDSPFDLADEMPEYDLKSLELTIRAFRNLSPSVLRKAMLRKVLYAPPSHGFLFSSDIRERDSFAIVSETLDADVLLERVISILKTAGFDIVRALQDDSFSFILMGTENARASISAAKTPAYSCVAIALVSPEKKAIMNLANRLRSLS
ncbi:ATP-binding protein [Candidatus Thorarchaeota archaeon]|nr:MAG: ATP-binding protein [Candidatus Thorarchaeota archaeon]